MARYRKIDVRIWGDKWFRGLTPLQPGGAALWLYLLTCPESGPIPGLIRAGEAALAEALGWELEAFREAFREVAATGKIKASWGDRLIWIPNAVKYSRPESPNVVISWRNAWDETPECELKEQVFRELKAFCEGLGESFGKAFEKACGKTMSNQEQEQEQEQEQDSTSTLREKSENQEQEALVLAEEPVQHDPAESFVAMWNETCGKVGLPRATKLTGARRQKIRARLRERKFAEWESIFRRVAASPFLTGRNDTGWRADIDWIIANETNSQKVCDGRYDARGKRQQRGVGDPRVDVPENSESRINDDGTVTLSPEFSRLFEGKQQ